MEKFCVNYDFLGSDVKICKTLAKILGKKLPVIVCIGTDAVVGDCLGPLVGSLLKERLKGKTYVFGTVESPVTAKNAVCLCFESIDEKSFDIEIRPTIKPIPRQA